MRRAIRRGLTTCRDSGRDGGSGMTSIHSLTGVGVRSVTYVVCSSSASSGFPFTVQDSLAALRCKSTLLPRCQASTTPELTTSTAPRSLLSELTQQQQLTSLHHCISSLKGRHNLFLYLFSSVLRRRDVAAIPGTPPVRIRTETSTLATLADFPL